MCGLVGVTSALALTEASKKAFYDMLHFDVVRGEDSTGVAAISEVDKEDKIEVFKSLGCTSDFFLQHRKSFNNRDFASGFVHTFIGHNRFATQGKVSIDNAHPFEFDNVVGAHNGTVDKYSLKDFTDYKKYDVDSQIIYSHLSATTIDEVWANADGALALTWWDKRTNKLNIIRNNQRPMSIIYSEDDKTVFWASEAGMIYLAAHRQGIKLKQPVEVPPNRLFTFSFTADNKMRHTERDLPPFVKKPTVYHYGSAGYRGGLDDWDDDYWMSPRQRQNSHKQTRGPIVMGGHKKVPNKPAELAPKPAEKVMIITEWHGPDINPSAFGYTQDGTPVRVVISQSEAKLAKDKIIGRGPTQKGYYVAPKLFNSHIQNNGLWVQWKNLIWCRFKEGHYIMRGENNAFEIHKVIELDNKDTATTFSPNTHYLPGAWQNKVSCGCLNCKAVPKWDEADTLKWISEEDFFCNSCAELPFIQDHLLEIKEQRSA